MPLPPGLSICMIVKNESANIAESLECFSPFADEIIIVDTGSSDNTKEIAARFTSRIYDFEWVDDFSAARNFAMSKAGKSYHLLAAVYKLRGLSVKAEECLMRATGRI